MSTFTTAEIRDWLVSNHQWNPQQGFVGSAQVTYDAAVHFNVTAAELDAAMNLPAGTVGKFLLDHGFPPLTGGGRAPLGPRNTDTAPPLPPRVAPAPAPGQCPNGRRVGDHVTNANGTFVVQPDCSLQHIDYGHGQAPAQPTPTQPRVRRGRSTADVPVEAPSNAAARQRAARVTVTEVAPTTAPAPRTRTASQNVRTTSPQPSSPAPTPATTPISTAPVAPPVVVYTPTADFASDPSMPAGGAGASAGPVGSLGVSNQTLVLGLAAGAALLVALTKRG